MDEMKIYKHKRNTDVAMMPVNIEATPEGLRIKCYWLNIVNPKNVFYCTNKLDHIFIKYEDNQNWTPYEQIQT